MSPYRRRIARRAAPLTEGELQHLATGASDFAGEGFATLDAAREAWRIHGRDVYAQLQAEYPRRVFWAVKQFGAPLRRCRLTP